MEIFSMGLPPTLRLKHIALQCLLFLSFLAVSLRTHASQKQSLPC